MVEQGPLTRRGVVKGAAGVAAAGTTLAVLGAGPAAAAAKGTRPQGEPGADAPGCAAPGQEVVVHVRDARTGLLDVFVGERHVQLRDRQLADALSALGDRG